MTDYIAIAQTATDYVDLLNKVRIFATNGAHTGAVWVAERDGLPGRPDVGTYPNELILRGPNDDALGKIYVGMKAVTGSAGSPSETYYNWKLNGMTGFSSGSAFDAQPGCIPDATQPHIALSNSLLTYWLVVNPRMIRIVVKVSSYWYHAYVGLLKQYASPGQLPYPLFVGGSRVASPDGTIGIGSPGFYHSAYFDPNGDGTKSPARFRRADGAWSFAYNKDFSDSFVGNPKGSTWPYYQPGISQLRDNIAGSVGLFPVMVSDKDPSSTSGDGSILGELDGIFAIPGVVAGVAQVSENTLGAGPDYIVFQNVHRTSANKFMAFKVI